jgi:hypothetical protein
MDLSNLLFFGLGLIVGWNFLPQPLIVKEIVDQLINAMKKLVK